MSKVKEIDLTELIAPYVKENLWLAFNKSLNTVLATGKTMGEAVANAKKNSTEKPVIMQAVKNYSAYILTT